MSKVLVTGGAGFIGSHVVEALLEGGDTVAILDDLSTGKKEWVHSKARFFEGSITDPKTVERVMEEVKPEIIHHLAAHKDVRVSVNQPAHDAAVNISGTLNLLATPQARELKQIVFASSAAVYGDTVEIPTPETASTKPQSPYGISKLTGEHYLRWFGALHKIPVAVLRFANVYGPRQDPYGEGGVVAVFTERLLRGKAPVIFGDGKQTRDFVFVGDVVAAMRVATQENSDGIFNIGTGKETSVNELAAQLAAITKSARKPTHTALGAGDPRRSVLDPTKARSDLGWRPTIPLANGLEETVAWFRSQSSQTTQN
jgi:UDP-glucose 4-epimerase